MGFEFHPVRRTVALAFKVSDIEFAMITSAQHRRGYEHVTHYIRELVWNDGASMAEPKFVAAAIKERWPQQSLEFVNTMKVSAVPRNWDAEYNRLCGMVRAAMILTPSDVPAWAAPFNVPTNTNVGTVEANELTNETAPASESKPKTGAKPSPIGLAKERVGRLKRRSGGTK